MTAAPRVFGSRPRYWIGTCGHNYPEWRGHFYPEKLAAARMLALCIAGSERMTTPVVATSEYGYLRLRDEGYRHADIARWARIIADEATRWKKVFVYCKHEAQGKTPELAKGLMTELGLVAT